MTATEILRCAEEWEQETPFGDRLSLGEAFARFNVGEPYAITGQWAVTVDGIECLVTDYFIDRDRVTADETANWIEHMTGKVWVDRFDFADAWNMAVKTYAQ